MSHRQSTIDYFRRRKWLLVLLLLVLVIAFRFHYFQDAMEGFKDGFHDGFNNSR
jgi:hypothetical protein